MCDPAFSSDVARLRQRLAVEPGLPHTDDQLEWADACAQAGLPLCARVLFETIFLRDGLSPQMMRRWRAIADRTKLWDAFPDAAPTGRPPTNSVEIALAELRDFATLAAPFLAKATSAAVKPSTSETVPHEVNLTGGLGDGTPFEALESASELFRFLSNPPPGNWSDATRLIGSIVAATDQMGTIDWRTLAGADLETVAMLLIDANLKAFVTDYRHLVSAQSGSAALLWRAARFDSAGLGPYFGNVGRIARKSKDVYELAYHASEAAEAVGLTDAGLAPWLFLLSDKLPRALMFEVVDDVGDHGDSVTLSLMYHRHAASGAPLNGELVWRIRDAALDNGDAALAARVQQFIVDASPDSVIELEILGSIYGTAGFIAAAEQAFMACLEIDPENTGVAERLVALRKHEFAPFRVESGYGTPEERSWNRKRNRQAQVVHKASGPAPTMVQLR